MLSFNIIFFFISLSITWILFKIYIPLFENYILDKPDERSSHIKPKPSSGGIIFIFMQLFFSTIISIFFNYENIYLVILFSLPLGILGILDDYKGLKNNFRFFFHILISIILVSISDIYMIQENYFLSIFIFIFSVFIACSFINFTNFMDGIDGLVGGCISVSFITYLVLNNSSIIWISLGSLAAFLIWNWYPAKIFMGDSGSTYLGAVVIGLVLQCDNLLDSFGLLLVSTPLFADAIICIFRRFLNRQNIFKPHKLHLYQRLHQAGFKHSKISTIYILSSCSISISFLMFSIKETISISLLVILIGFLIDKKYAVKFE